jgi:prepilin-type N-terminal cleavage/methylation domain-containing protein
MRHWRGQGGFTLVELTIVLAIMAALLTGVLAGSATIQNRTEFTSAVDAMRYQLKEVQNEAIQGVSARSGSNSGTSDEINFGKLVELDNTNTGPSPKPNTQMKVWTLVENSDHTALVKCDQQNITLAQGLTFLKAYNQGSGAGTQAVIFGRQPNQLYVDPNFTETLLPDASAMSCSPPAPVPVYQLRRAPLRHRLAKITPSTSVAFMDSTTLVRP